MIEKIEAMPAGTIGFRASGKLTRSDYRDVLEPWVAKAFRFFAWMTPGEVKVYGSERRDEALGWVAS